MRVTYTRTQLTPGRAHHGYAPGIVPPVDRVFGIGPEFPPRVEILESMEKPTSVTRPGRRRDSFERGWTEPYRIYRPNGRAA